MITVIAPHARPQFAENLLDNFRRQVGVEARLVVVENGEAIGSNWPSDVIVLKSQAHQADAMNVGLSATRGAWARFDDDDYYGASYLANVALTLNTHEVTGKTWGFVLFDDGMYRFHGEQDDFAAILTGGTLAAATPNVAPFQRRDDDDVQWCRDMRAAGSELWASDHSGYCYDRRTIRHGAARVITTAPAVFRWAFTEGEYHGQVCREYVNAPGDALRSAPAPTDDELMAAFGCFQGRQ